MLRQSLDNFLQFSCLFFVPLFFNFSFSCLRISCLNEVLCKATDTKKKTEKIKTIRLLRKQKENSVLVGKTGGFGDPLHVLLLNFFSVYSLFMLFSLCCCNCNIICYYMLLFVAASVLWVSGSRSCCELLIEKEKTRQTGKKRQLPAIRKELLKEK